MTVKYIRMTLIALAAVAGMLLIGYLFRTGPQKLEPGLDEKPRIHRGFPLGVTSPEFEAPTKYAIEFLNSVCPSTKRLFYWARHAVDADIIVLSDTGTPCGDPWRPADEEGHRATAYQCMQGQWETMITLPGDLHDQLCLVAHELGRYAGLAGGDVYGIMSNHCETPVRITDKDREILENLCQ